ncbi:tetratricopeptide repeat protein [uncultured Aquimarina sp.]|uniref:tetratricopeptide repeat protein n=1 Tax=uncultured Aquimarina sp. TaxID=575652 RepID=UPI002627C51B|nr:tetratricopeptide repeat protein [uncultured Aquimarina sp.]
MKKSVIIVFICSLLFTSLVFSAQEQDTTAVRLTTEVKLAQSDTAKIKALIDLGDYQIIRDFRKAEKHFLHALELIKKGPETEKQETLAVVYGALGIVSKRKGDYPEAVDYYLKSLNLYKELKDDSNIADIYHNMAMVFRDQKDYKKSIEYFKKTIVLKDSLHEEKGVAIVYNMMGVAYRQSKQMDSAYNSYQKAKATFLRLQDQENIYRVNSNLAAWYHTQKQYQKAIAIYKENLEYDDKTNRRLSLQRVYYNIAGGYMQLKEYRSALNYIDQALTIAKEQQAKTRISKSYLRRSFILRKLENYKEALENYRLHKKYSDSVFNIENAKKVQALELKYQFNQEKLADSLQFAKEKSELTLITEAETAQKRLYFILFLVTVIAGIVITYLIRRIYRSRVRLAAEALEKNKQELTSFIKQLVAKSKEQEELTKELDKLKAEVVQKSSLKKLQEVAAEKILTKDDWYNFKEKFVRAYPSFFENIKQKGYELTQSEERLVAMEKLGLDTRQIANMLAISEDSVMMNRYRLRKKINSPKGAPILEYLEN